LADGKKTNWKKEFGKSVRFAAKEVLTDLTPNTFGLARSMAKDIRELRQDLRKMTQQQGVMNSMAKSQTGDTSKYVEAAVKNLKDSLASGQFYKEERKDEIQNMAMGNTGSMSDDYPSYDSGEDAYHESEPADLNPVNRMMADLADETAGGFSKLNQSMNESTRVLVKGFGALSDDDKRSFILSAALQKRYHNEKVGYLKAMNENLVNLVTFNNQTNATFVTASMQYYDESLEVLRGIKGTLDNVYAQKEVEADYYRQSDAAKVFEGGRFNLKNYFNYVRRNFSRNTSGGSFGMLSMLTSPMFAGDIYANPAHEALKFGISSMIPGRLKKSIKNFDADMREWTPAAINKLSKKKTGISLIDGLLEQLEIKNRAGMNMYNPGDFKRGPMAFTGEAHKAITEIIPDFLSRILFSLDTFRISFQRSLIQHKMEGLNTESAQYKQYQEQLNGLGKAQQIRFDWSDNFLTGGRYVTQDVIEKRIKEERRNAALSGYYDTRREVDRAAKVLYGQDWSKDSKKNQIRDRIDDVFEAIVLKSIDYYDKNTEERLNIIKKYAYHNDKNYPKNEALEIMAILDGLSNRAKANIIGMGKIQGRERMAEYYHEYNTAGGLVDMRNAHNENNGIFNVSQEGSIEWFNNDEGLGIYKNARGKWEMSNAALEAFNKKHSDGLLKPLKLKNAYEVIKYLQENERYRYGTTEGQLKNAPSTETPEERAKFIKQTIQANEKLHRYGAQEEYDTSTLSGKIKALFNAPITILDNALNTIDECAYKLIFGQDGIVSQFKDGLTGTKNKETGEYEGGLFSEFVNGAKEITGAAADSMKTWLPQQMKGLGNIVRQYFFGEDEVDKDGKPVEKEPIMTRMAAKVQLQFSAWSNALFGGSDDGKTDKDGKPLGKDAMLKKAATSFKNAIPNIGKGIAAGAGLGVVAGLGGFGLLGSLFLPGGPIGGAIVGGALAFLNQSKGFREMMFGKEETDENGKKRQVGGLIPKSFTNFLKKAKIPLIGGAVTGMISHLFGHGIAFGLMPSMAVAAVGPVLAGAAWGLASHSNAFREAIFGKEMKNADGTKKRIGGLLNNSIMRKLKNVLPKGIAGGLTGVASMGVISQLGIVGSTLALGPIPAAITGAALGIATSSKKFTQAFFGYTDKHGKYHSGTLDRVKNYFTWEIFKPMKMFITRNMFNTKTWFKKNVAYPIADALIPIKIYMKKVGDRLVDSMAQVTKPIQKGVKWTFKRIEEKIEKIFSPILSAIGRLARLTFNTAKTITKASIKATLAPLTIAGKLASGALKWDAYKKGVGGSFNALNANLASGNISGTISSGVEFAKSVFSPRHDYEKDKYAKELVEYQDAAKLRNAKLDREIKRGNSYFDYQQQQFEAERAAVRLNKYNLTDEEVKSRLKRVDKEQKENDIIQAKFANTTDVHDLVQKKKLDLLTQIKEALVQVVANTGKSAELDERNKDDNAIKAAQEAEIQQQQQQLVDNIQNISDNTEITAKATTGQKKLEKGKSKSLMDKLFGGQEYSGGIMQGMASIASGVGGIISLVSKGALALGVIAALIAKFLDKDEPEAGGPTDRMNNSRGMGNAVEHIGKFGARHLGVVGSVAKGIGRFAVNTGKFITNIPKNIKGALQPTRQLQQINGTWVGRQKTGLRETIKSKLRGGLEAAESLVNRPIQVVSTTSDSVLKKVKSGLTSALDAVMNSSVAQKLFGGEKLKTFWNAIKSLGKKITEPKTYELIMKVIKSSKGGAGKLAKLAGKIGTRLGADTFTGGLAIAAFAAYDGYTGWTEAYRMFDVNPEDVDTKMKMINTFVNILFGNAPPLMLLDFALCMCSIGMIGLSDTFFGQLLSKFGFNLANFDHRKVVCQFIYKFLATDTEADNLADKQNDLLNEYNSWIEKHPDKAGMTLEEYQAKVKGNATMWEKYGAPILNRVMGVTDENGNQLPTVSEMLSDSVKKLTTYFKSAVDFIWGLTPMGFLQNLFGVPSLSDLAEGVGNTILEAGTKVKDWLFDSNTKPTATASANDYVGSEDDEALENAKKSLFKGKGHGFDEESSDTKVRPVKRPPAGRKLKQEVDKFGDFVGGKGLGPTIADYKVMEGDTGMPYYAQNDTRWRNLPLAPNSDATDKLSVTLGRAGCGPASMAMIVSKLSGTNFDPEDASQYVDQTDLSKDGFGVKPGYFAGVASAANMYGHVLKDTSVAEFKNLLETGHMMILGGKSANPFSPFFGRGHYLVAAGLSPQDSNKALIYDPDGKSRDYSIADLLDQSIQNDGWGAYFDYQVYNAPGTIGEEKLQEAAENKGDKNKKAPGKKAPSRRRNNAAMSKVRNKGKRRKKYEGLMGAFSLFKDSIAGAIKATLEGKKWTPIDWKNAYEGGDYGRPDGLRKSGTAEYKQDDERWWDHKYTFSTVAIGGCMPTTFCNMASMYGVKVLPPEACDFAGANGMHVQGGTTLSFFPAAASKWNVPVHSCGSWDEVMEDLNTGRPVAAGFEGGDGWSKGGHWMLMTTTEDDKIYIVDTRRGVHNTDRDISGWHSVNETYVHWAGPGYAFGADNVPKGGGGGSFDASSGRIDTKKAVWNYLVNDLEINRAGAAGIMGNIEQESGFRTEAYNPNDNGGPSGGLVQWHNDRFTGLKDYAASIGKSWEDVDSQMGYLSQELNSSKKHVYDEIQNASNVESAVDTWVRKFEIPANIPGEIKNRTPMAQSYFDDHSNFVGGKKGFNPEDVSGTVTDDEFAGGFNWGRALLYAASGRQYNAELDRKFLAQQKKQKELEVKKKALAKPGKRSSKVANSWKQPLSKVNPAIYNRLKADEAMMDMDEIPITTTMSPVVAANPVLQQRVLQRRAAMIQKQQEAAMKSPVSIDLDAMRTTTVPVDMKPVEIKPIGTPINKKPAEANKPKAKGFKLDIGNFLAGIFGLRKPKAKAKPVVKPTGAPPAPMVRKPEAAPAATQSQTATKKLDPIEQMQLIQEAMISGKPIGDVMKQPEGKAAVETVKKEAAQAAKKVEAEKKPVEANKPKAKVADPFGFENIFKNMFGMRDTKNKPKAEVKNDQSPAATKSVADKRAQELEMAKKRSEEPLIKKEEPTASAVKNSPIAPKILGSDSNVSMTDLIASIKALDAHAEYAQMIALLKVIAEKAGVSVNNNNIINPPPGAPGHVDQTKMKQALNKLSKDKHQVPLSDKRLRDLLNMGDATSDFSVNQYQMAYKISQGGAFKTV